MILLLVGVCLGVVVGMVVGDVLQLRRIRGLIQRNEAWVIRDKRGKYLMLPMNTLKEEMEVEE